MVDSQSVALPFTFGGSPALGEERCWADLEDGGASGTLGLPVEDSPSVALNIALTDGSVTCRERLTVSTAGG